MEDKIVVIAKDGISNPKWMAGVHLPFHRKPLGSWVVTSQDPVLFFHLDEDDDKDVQR